MAIESEQLIVGALLNGFTKIDKLEYSLLKKDFEAKQGIEVLPINITSLSEYIEIKNNIITLKTDIDITPVLYKKESTIISNYFKKFSIEDFILQKIKKISFIDIDDIETVLTKDEIKILNKLVKEGYLKEKLEENAILESKHLSISKKGEVRLYKYENQKEYQDFLETLRILRCNIEIVDDYLMASNLEFPTWGVFNITNIYEYSKAQNQRITSKGVEELHFQYPSEDDLEELLGSNINEHLYICHPNNIIKEPKPISNQIDYIININWEEIDINKMFNTNKYIKITEKDTEKALRTLKSFLSEEAKGNDSLHKYGIIVSETKNNLDYTYYIKGIVEYDYLGLKVVLNKKKDNTLKKIKK